MEPDEVLKAIYFGDRSCKAIVVDGWRERICVTFDVLSRLATGATSWDFDSSRDIPDGCLVFTGAKSVRFNPSGPIPNDLVNDIQAVRRDEPNKPTNWVFTLSIGSVNSLGETTEVTVTIEAAGLQVQGDASDTAQ